MRHDQSRLVQKSAMDLGSDYPLLVRKGRNLQSTKTYPKGVEIFSQDQLLSEVFYLASGWIKLVELDDKGTEIIVRLAPAGSWLGTASAIAGIPSDVSALTCTQAQVASMTTGTFQSLLIEDSDFSLLIHKAHAQELCRQSGHILQLSSLSSRQRLLCIVREFVEAAAPERTLRPTRVYMPLLHRELAQMVAVTPEHLSRLLRDLDVEGLVHREKGWITVPNLAHLCLCCSRDEPTRSASQCDTLELNGQSERRRGCNKTVRPAEHGELIPSVTFRRTVDNKLRHTSESAQRSGMATAGRLRTPTTDTQQLLIDTSPE